jgi:hypothetical protein
LAIEALPSGRLEIGAVIDIVHASSSKKILIGLAYLCILLTGLRPIVIVLQCKAAVAGKARAANWLEIQAVIYGILATSKTKILSCRTTGV